MSKIWQARSMLLIYVSLRHALQDTEKMSRTRVGDAPQRTPLPLNLMQEPCWEKEDCVTCRSRFVANVTRVEDLTNDTLLA